MVPKSPLACILILKTGHFDNEDTLFGDYMYRFHSILLYFLYYIIFWQTFYEFCFGEIDKHFSVTTTLPRLDVPCTMLADCGITRSSTLAMCANDGSDGDILDLVGGEQVSRILLAGVGIHLLCIST